jgi:hypothetical protein
LQNVVAKLERLHELQPNAIAVLSVLVSDYLRDVEDRQEQQQHRQS